jgi:hypothetical protein
MPSMQVPPAEAQVDEDDVQARGSKARRRRGRKMERALVSLRLRRVESRIGDPG